MGGARGDAEVLVRDDGRGTRRRRDAEVLVRDNGRCTQRRRGFGKG